MNFFLDNFIDKYPYSKSIPKIINEYKFGNILVDIVVDFKSINTTIKGTINEKYWS